MLLAHTHPEEALEEHLCQAARLARSFLRPVDRSLAQLAWMAGLCHDLGKATPYFQEYLRGKRPKGDPLARHSLPGALFAAWWALERGLPPEDALLLFMAIVEHHGSLRTPWDRLPPDLLKGHWPRGTAWEALEDQLRTLGEPWEALAASLGLPDPKPFLEGGYRGTIRELYLRAEELLDRGAERDLPRHYRLALIYSALLDADRRLAARRSLFPKAKPIPEGAVVAHVRAAKAREGSPLGPLRERLFQGVAEALSKPLDLLFPGHLTLTAPTGAGKTLAALRLALGLRERVYRERGFRPKVVYALPYIAIADQVEMEARRVLEEAGLDPQDHLLVHHHLALAPKGQGKEPQEGESVEEALLLRETWDRDLILTTFQQVVRLLLGQSPGALRPLHGLARGAILILDEVQTIPAEHWPLVRALLSHLPGRVTVVSMTATQPALLPSAREVAPPLEAPPRVRLAWAPFRTLEELAEEVAQRAGEGRSVLVVLNTIQEAVGLYQGLKGRSLPHLYHLSSHLIPKHRRQVIQRVSRDLGEGKPVVLVATQVVEAGVDLDFQEGFRAFAPFDSLLQSAGRINRHARLPEGGRLWVVDLEGESGAHIYKRVLLHRTREILEPLLREGIWDQDLYPHLERYYRAVEEGISTSQSKEVLRCLGSLDYDNKTLSQFSLLEDKPTLPIFVEWDEEASVLLERLERALGEEDPWKRRQELRLLYPMLEAYTVSPLLRRALKNP
ncbi:MAG: CRISPR-associated helicase Cas3', partial [Thermus sp.]